MKKTKRKFIKSFYRGNRLNFALALAATIIMSFANLVISWLLQQVIDCATGNGNAYSFKTLLVILFVIIGIMGLFSVLLYFSKPAFISKAMKQYKDTALDKISQKGISAFRRENTSLYSSALSNDAASIEKSYLESSFDLIMHLILFVGAFSMMLWYSPLLTLVTIGFTILPVTASLLTGNRVAVAEKELSDKNESYMSMLKDCLTGFSVIKSFKAEKKIIAQLSEANSRCAAARCRRGKIAVVLETIGLAAGFITQFGVFFFSAYLALSGKGITAGVIILFVQLINFVINPIASVPKILSERKAAKALISKLAEAVSDNVREEGTRTLPTLEKGIEMRNVTFGYDEKKTILHNISVSFEAGKSYALVGASGSGKSTLLNLLMASHGGFEGEICYDGTPVCDIKSDSLYDLVSVVEQNVFIFNASIRDNITMFGDFPKTEVDRAIELSGLSALIAQKGEDYLCGENGSGLSGGEKQRISIARSMLRNSQVLFADEATAALDKATAYQVTDAILNLDGITRITVTHALDESLLRRYDCIITMKSGQIAESGSFSELMEKKGYFYSLYTVSQ